MKRLLLLIALLAAPMPALAGPTLAERYGAPVDACYRHQRDSRQALEPCQGILTQACIASEPQGETTLGMSLCTQAEYRYWDRWLNVEYQATRAHFRDLDQAGLPENAVRVDRLRSAQRAWIAFRDADCDLAFAIWGGGTIRQIMGPQCQAQRTFQRVKELIQMQEGLE